VAGAVSAPPPVALEHDAVLAGARPVHSWMCQSISDR